MLTNQCNYWKSKQQLSLTQRRIKMIRKLFIDVVVVLALCTVVWGSAPVLASCVCIANTGECKTVQNDQNEQVCEQTGICKVGWSVVLYWPFVVEYTCSCVHTVTSNCLCIHNG